MKRIVRLTEGDLHRIVKRSVNRVLRESEIDGDKNFDDAGFVDSISKFCEKPVDMNNYDPSDEDIYGALGEFNPDDLDTDFSDLMSYNQQNESRKRFGRRINEVSSFPNDWKSRRKKPSEEPEKKPWKKRGEGIDDWRDGEPDDKSWKDKSKWKTMYGENRIIDRAIRRSISKALREASVYPGYDSTTTADIAGNGDGNVGGSNIITCYGTPNAIKGGGVGSILGSGVIYLGCNLNYSKMYGNVVPVKVDVSNFYRAKNSSEAIKLAGSPGFKDEYSGILYHSNMDGDVCAVFDRSCIIG